MKPTITLRLLVVASMLLLITISVSFAQSAKVVSQTSTYEVKAGTFANGVFTPITASDTANSTKDSFKRAFRDAVIAKKAAFSYKGQWHTSGVLIEKSTINTRPVESELLNIKSDSTGLTYYFKTVKGGLIVKYDMPTSKIDFYINKKMLPSHSPSSAVLVKNVYAINLAGKRVVVKSERITISSDEVRELVK